MGKPLPDALFVPAAERDLDALCRTPEGREYFRALLRLAQAKYAEIAAYINENWADRATPAPTGLTPTPRQAVINASGQVDVDDLSNYVTGTARRVSASDDGAGGVVLSGPQDLDPTDTPTFAGLSLNTGELTAGSINRASGDLTLEIGGTPVVTVGASAVTLAQNLVVADGKWIGNGASSPRIVFDDTSNEVELRGGNVLIDNNKNVLFDATNTVHSGAFSNLMVGGGHSANVTSQNNSLFVGYQNTMASGGNRSLLVGFDNTVSGEYCLVAGQSITVSGNYSSGFGKNAGTFSVSGGGAFGQGNVFPNGALTVSGHGAVGQGYVTGNSVANAGTIESTGYGSFAGGYSEGYTAVTLLSASGNGAYGNFCFGSAYDGTHRAKGFEGCVSLGANVDVDVSGSGAYAGYAGAFGYNTTNVTPDSWRFGWSASGGVLIEDDVLWPQTDSGYTLGSASFRFTNGYFDALNIDGNITCTGTVDGVDLSGLGATYAPIAKGVTNGDSHDHSGGDGAQVDHGGLAGLSDDDHSQYHNDTRGDARYIAKSLGTAAGDIVYFSASGTPVRLAKGSDDDVLTLASGVPSWAAPAGGGGVPASNCCIEVGEYTGDGGTNKQVSLTASWDPIFVVVREKSTAIGSSAAGMYMVSGATYASFFTATARDRVRLGTASFYVDDDGGNNDPNASGVDYVYIALGIATS